MLNYPILWSLLIRISVISNLISGLWKEPYMCRVSCFMFHSFISHERILMLNCQCKNLHIRMTLPVQFRFYTTHWQNLEQYDNIFNSKVAAVVDHRINHMDWKSYTTKQKVDNVNASIKKIYTKGWKGKLCVWQILFAKEQRGRPQIDVIYWIGRILKYI